MIKIWKIMMGVLLNAKLNSITIVRVKSNNEAIVSFDQWLKSNPLVGKILLKFNLTLQ